MNNQKGSKINFKGMSYRNVQTTNSKNRTKLPKEEQAWLKENGYQNIGWNNIINLYLKIEDFFTKQQLEDLTLEDLFLEADRIGNKYLTSQEITEFNQRLAIEVNEISEIIDQQFPDSKMEFIDFSKNLKNRYRNKKYIKP
ncbi:hypothetical protein [Calothrix sp. NIES-2098]|uniref:hypothetical protein n=1 Tax=Calothrix sp. NIES-2098 TaxID=1954171 RepID=UPI000B5EF52A|nr:hypothetical protein NIES2098_39300 [Calothrix sp. NIES-2098]